jgi:hypothetical protein
MELRDFISNALLAITQGVSDANDVTPRFRLARKIHADGTSGDEVEFDMQVVVTESGERNAKGGISVSVVKIGGEAKSAQTNQSSHHLKFSVFISES